MTKLKKRSLADELDSELLSSLYAAMYQRKTSTYRPRPFDVEPNRKLIASFVRLAVASPFRRR